jgi:hypothetical protein
MSSCAEAGRPWPITAAERTAAANNRMLRFIG